MKIQIKVSVLFLILIIGDNVSRRRSWFGRHFCNIFCGQKKAAWSSILEIKEQNEFLSQVKWSGRSLGQPDIYKSNREAMELQMFSYKERLSCEQTILSINRLSNTKRSTVSRDTWSLHWRYISSCLIDYLSNLKIRSLRSEKQSVSCVHILKECIYKKITSTSKRIWVTKYMSIHLNNLQHI